MRPLLDFNANFYNVLSLRVCEKLDYDANQHNRPEVLPIWQLNWEVLHKHGWNVEENFKLAVVNHIVDVVSWSNEVEYLEYTRKVEHVVNKRLQDI